MRNRWLGGIWRLWHDQHGASALEYGLICALIFLAMAAAVGTVADETTSMWGKVTDEYNAVAPQP